MDYNELVMHTGAEPTIEQCGYQEPSIKIGSHLYVAAMVLPGLHTYEEVRIDQTVQTRYDVHDQSECTDHWGDRREDDPRAGSRVARRIRSLEHTG
eukprot:2983728-Amphidinium_carterae.1